MSQQRAPRRFDERWRLSRAGIVNVWHYLDNEFDLSGGRMILRGTNGSGKSRALEMLLPFLLDADRRRMDATGAARVNLDELMRTGAQGQSNRTGYLWLELCRSELGRPDGYLTVGALVRHSQSASSTKVWYFTSPLRVGDGLELMSASREPLSREALTELVGTERITDSKHLIYEGMLVAVKRGAEASATGVLVDEQFGGDIPRDAKEKGLQLSMPVEKTPAPTQPARTGTAFAPRSSGWAATPAGIDSTACCNYCTRCARPTSATASTRGGCRRFCWNHCRRCTRRP